MPPSLSLFPNGGDSGSDGHAGPPGPPPLSEPIPIQIRSEEVDAEEGPVTHHYLVWFNDEGSRCRWCGPGHCNFAPTASGVGTCLVKRPGGLAGSLPGLGG